MTLFCPHPTAQGRLGPRRSERGAGHGGAYLLPEVDGYVGDAQGHQEPDQGPVVRERREFHHSPHRGLTPHTSAASRGLCGEARGERAERAGAREHAGRLRRGLGAAAAAAAASSPSAAALAGDPQAQVHPCCPPTQQRSAGEKKRRDGGGGGGGGSRRFC